MSTSFQFYYNVSIKCHRIIFAVKFSDLLLFLLCIRVFIMYHFISTSFLLNIFYVLFWKRILKVSFGILILWIMFLVHPSLEIPMFWAMLILWGFAGDCPAAFDMEPRPGRVISLSLAR